MAEPERSMSSIRRDIARKGIERRRAETVTVDATKAAATATLDPSERPVTAQTDRRAMWRRGMAKAAAEAVTPK